MGEEVHQGRVKEFMSNLHCKSCVRLSIILPEVFLFLFLNMECSITTECEGRRQIVAWVRVQFFWQ